MSVQLLLGAAAVAALVCLTLTEVPLRQRYSLARLFFFLCMTLIWLGPDVVSAMSSDPVAVRRLLFDGAILSPGLGYSSLVLAAIEIYRWIRQHVTATEDDATPPGERGSP
jgi:hypothetical protein